MMNDEFEVRVMSAPWYDGVEVLIVKRGMGACDRLFVVNRIDAELVEEGVVIAPTFRMNGRQTQLLMDDLWHSGVRPSEGVRMEGGDKLRKGMNQHIGDLRDASIKLLDLLGRSWR